MISLRNEQLAGHLDRDVAAGKTFRSTSDSSMCSTRLTPGLIFQVAIQPQGYALVHRTVLQQPVKVSKRGGLQLFQPRNTERGIELVFVPVKAVQKVC